MKARPILFSGPMVRAILEGRKTQTRRIVKPQPVPFGKSGYGGTRQGWKFDPEGINRSWNDDDKDPYRGEPLATMAMRALCPYGQPGDLLWVKETFYAGKSPRVRYRADDMVRIEDGSFERALAYEPKWKSPIFMPRKASRVTLEVVAVRVERLHDISDDDVEAEGVKTTKGTGMIAGDRCFHFAGNSGYSRIGWHAYKELWESVNGPGSWDANPWVWVVEFKRTCAVGASVVASRCEDPDSERHPLPGQRSAEPVRGDCALPGSPQAQAEPPGSPQNDPRAARPLGSGSQGGQAVSRSTWKWPDLTTMTWVVATG